MPEGRILQLKFLDQVSGPVQTGNVLRGINDECLKLALVDSGEQIVKCGPAEAEIVLLDDGNGTITHETFKRRIIKTGEKKKPHFTKRVFIDLKEGVGDLAGLQLGQGSGWTKNCNCRLRATLVQSPGGIVACSAWTPPFKVGDKRNTSKFASMRCRKKYKLCICSFKISPFERLSIFGDFLLQGTRNMNLHYFLLLFVTVIVTFIEK